MQRFVPMLVALGPAVLGAQQAAGAELWRLAGVTVSVPAALARDGAAAFWNPAQEADGARTLASLEAIETPEIVGASGLLASLRVQVKGMGRVGLIYGRMQLGGLTRTSFGPDDNGGTIPFYTHTAGLTWTRSFGATTLGATAGYHDTQLDDLHESHWTFDIGAARRINDVLRLAAATHFFARFQTADNVQDLYGAAELRATGMPLGLMPGMSYEEKETTLLPGETVVFYSDGLVEAHKAILRREVASLFVPSWPRFSRTSD